MSKGNWSIFLAWQPNGIQSSSLPVSPLFCFNPPHAVLDAIKLDFIYGDKSQTSLWWNAASAFKAWIIIAENRHLQKQEKVGYFLCKIIAFKYLLVYQQWLVRIVVVCRYSKVRERMEREVIGVLRNPKVSCPSPTTKLKVSGMLFLSKRKY